jgi:hypothetical protein
MINDGLMLLVSWSGGPLVVLHLHFVVLVQDHNLQLAVLFRDLNPCSEQSLEAGDPDREVSPLGVLLGGEGDPPLQHLVDVVVEVLLFAVVVHVKHFIEVESE